MAVKLTELLAAQKQMTQKEGQVQERMSIAELRQLAAQSQESANTQTEILEGIDTTLKDEKIIQLSQQTEAAKAKLASEEAKEATVDALNEINETLNDKLTKDDPKGLGSNVEKLVALAQKQAKNIERILAANQPAKATTDKALGGAQRLTIGEKFSALKEKITPIGILRTIEKTVEGGIVGDMLANAVGKKADTLQRAKDIETLDPERAKSLGAQGVARLAEQQVTQQRTAQRQMRVTERRISETGLSDEELAKFKGGRQLLGDRVRNAKMFEKADIMSLAPTAKRQYEETEQTSRKSSPISEPTFSDEAAVETSRREDKMISLLEKIEENTRGAGAGDKGGPKEPAGQGFGSKLGALGETVGKLGGAAKTLLALSAALWVTSKAFQNFATLDWNGIAKGLVAMGSLAVVTKMIGSGGNAKTLLALGGAIWIVSKAFQNFAEIDWSGVGKGLVAVGGLAALGKVLGENMGSMLKGALGLVALGGALWVIGEALESFMQISWEDLAKAGVAITGLAVGAATIGAFAAPIALGAAVLAGLGAAVWVLGEGLQAVGEGITSLVDNVVRLGDIDGSNLISVGAGLAAVAAGIVAFSAGSAVAGLTNLVSGFLNLITPGKSPIEQLMDLAKVGPNLEKAGIGIKALSEGIKELSGLDKDAIDAIAKLPADKIAALGVAVGKMNAEKGAAGKKAEGATAEKQPALLAPADAKKVAPTAQRKKRTEGMFIADEPVVPGQPLSEKQVAVVDMAMSQGNKYPPEVMKSYQLAKEQKSAAAATVAAAPTEAATVYNKSAQVAPSAQEPAQAPVVVSAPTVNNTSQQTQNITMPKPTRNTDSGFNRYTQKNTAFI